MLIVAADNIGRQGGLSEVWWFSARFIAESIHLNRALKAQADTSSPDGYLTATISIPRAVS